MTQCSTMQTSASEFARFTPCTSEMRLNIKYMHHHICCSWDHLHRRGRWTLQMKQTQLPCYALCCQILGQISPAWTCESVSLHTMCVRNDVKRCIYAPTPLPRLGPPFSGTNIIVASIGQRTIACCTVFVGNDDIHQQPVEATLNIKHKPKRTVDVLSTPIPPHTS